MNWDLIFNQIISGKPTEDVFTDLIKEVSKEFKEIDPLLPNKLQYWGEKVLALRIATIGAVKEEDKREAEKTERYAWGAIYSLKAQNQMLLESTLWKFIEKLLIAVKNILLRGI